MGIIVFDKEGNILTRISSYGNGPGEFTSITSFAVDYKEKLIYVYDINSFKMMVYDYSGKFVKSLKSDFLLTDFAKVGHKETLCFYPQFTDDVYPSGVWLTDSLNNYVKAIRDDVSEECDFYYFPMTYNQLKDTLLYYDKNMDVIYQIENGMSQKKYQFNLKQKMPPEVKKNNRLTPKDVDGYAMNSCFANSFKYLLMTYRCFSIKGWQYRFQKWVLLNKQNGKLVVADNLINDLDDAQCNDEMLYYLTDHLWCRVVDSEENSLALKLQILHIKQ